MRYAIISHGHSRSFPKDDPFLTGASSLEEAPIVLYMGAELTPQPEKAAVLVELGNECLAVHTGEDSPEDCRNVLGFARYRNGSDSPSGLIELVRQRDTTGAVLAAARGLFEGVGLDVAICFDQPGRIIDRLVRPKYNAALRFLDEGLATQKDLDLTCKLGLGYPDGPVERVVRGGLAYHYDVTQALFEAFGTPAYAPAPRAIAAAKRRGPKP
jgi:3-hydroxybutyryl-CoA dehydrogenase